MKFFVTVSRGAIDYSDMPDLIEVSGDVFRAMLAQSGKPIPSPYSAGKEPFMVLDLIAPL